MKTVSELLGLINQAILNNGSEFHQWFIDFSGHINSISVSYYRAGWKRDGDNISEKIDIRLDEEGSIQEGYWFFKNRLR